MKLSKPILKQIIKESLEDEYKEKLLMLFKAGNHQQAIELSKQVGMEDFLVGADLEGANLEGADLKGADLEDAFLRGSDLVGADLKGANLKDAFLYLSNLARADLRGANLTGAELRATNMFDVIYDESTVWPEGFKP